VEWILPGHSSVGVEEAAAGPESELGQRAEVPQSGGRVLHVVLPNLGIVVSHETGRLWKGKGVGPDRAVRPLQTRRVATGRDQTHSVRDRRLSAEMPSFELAV
jgi:hypothetical protein